MFCGPESKKPNARIQLNMTEGQGGRLARLNEMDRRLYSELVSPCGWGGDDAGSGGGGGKEEGGTTYRFPEVDKRRLIGQGNRTSCGRRSKGCK